MQKIVNGYIETVALNEKTTLVCNEEGKLNGSFPNRYISTGWIVDTIYGNFFLCGNNEEGDDFDDIEEEEIKLWQKYMD